VKGLAEKPNYIMKNTIITLAALIGALVATAIVLSVRPHVSVDAAIGYTSVIALVGVAVLEYRINWRRLFSR
jgi:hypothetical protein